MTDRYTTLRRRIIAAQESGQKTFVIRVDDAADMLDVVELAAALGRALRDFREHGTDDAADRTNTAQDSLEEAAYALTEGDA